MRWEGLSLRRGDKLLRVGQAQDLPLQMWKIGTGITPCNRCVMVGVFHRLRPTQPTGFVPSF